MPFNFYLQMLWILLEKGQEPGKIGAGCSHRLGAGARPDSFVSESFEGGTGSMLELAMQAYKRAKKSAKVNADPVAAAMRALGEVLVKHRILPNGGIDFGARIWRKWARRFPEGLGLPEGISLSAAALPPIARRHMPAAVLQAGRRHRDLTRSTADVDGRIGNKTFYLIGALVAILLIIFFGT